MIVERHEGWDVGIIWGCLDISFDKDLINIGNFVNMYRQIFYEQEHFPQSPEKDIYREEVIRLEIGRLFTAIYIIQYSSYISS